MGRTLAIPIYKARLLNMFHETWQLCSTYSLLCSLRVPENMLSKISQSMVELRIAKHGSALNIGMAKVLPIIDVLGYDGQNYYRDKCPLCLYIPKFRFTVSFSVIIQFCRMVANVNMYV